MERTDQGRQDMQRKSTRIVDWIKLSRTNLRQRTRHRARHRPAPENTFHETSNSSAPDEYRGGVQGVPDRSGMLGEDFVVECDESGLGYPESGYVQ